MGFNPLKPNGISQSYQLNQSISVLRVVGWYFFHFYSNFKRIFCKQIVETLIRRRLSGSVLFAHAPQNGQQAYMD